MTDLETETLAGGLLIIFIAGLVRFSAVMLALSGRGMKQQESVGHDIPGCQPAAHELSVLFTNSITSHDSMTGWYIIPKNIKNKVNPTRCVVVKYQCVNDSIPIYHGSIASF